MAGNNSLNFGSKVVFLNGLPLTLPTTSADPGTATAGDMYYNSTSHVIRYYNGTSWGQVGAGSVTSVGLADGSTTPIYSISNSPVTGTGTLTFTLNTQPANQVLAGPSTGASAQPAFRALVSADIPSLAYANQQLSNLGTTAINVNVNPAQTNSYSLGMITLSWANIYAAQHCFTNSGNSGCITIAAPSGAATYALVLPSAQAAAAGYVLSNNGSGTLSWAPVTATSALDGTFRIDNTADPTKQIAFSAAGITTGNTRTITMPDANVDLGNLTNSNIAAAAGIVYSKLTLTGSIVNTDINGSAAIAYSKLAALTGSTNSVLTQNSSGFVQASGILSTNLFLADGSVTATGAHNQGSFKITNLAAGTVSTDAVNYGQVILVSGANPWTASQSLGGFTITSSGTPVNPGDLVPKSYVDNFINATSWKTAALVATTANITLSGEQTIDGVTTSSSRVLVKNQSTASQNGIYTSGSGAWTRTSDMNTWSEVPAAAIFVESGTVNADLGFVCTSQPGGTLGTSAINFVQFSSAGSYSADGVTLQLVSGVFSIKNGGVGTTQLGTITDGITLDQAGTGSTLEVKAGGISNTQVAAAAAIAYSKLAALSLNIIPTTDGTNGYLESTSANAVSLYSAGFKRGLSGSNVVSETYNDSLSLTDATTASVSAFSFAIASFAGEEISYVIETGTSSIDTRIGTIRVSCSNGSSPVVSLTDMYSESADCGVVWSATYATGTVTVSYTTTTQSAARTMRADVKQFRR